MMNGIAHRPQIAWTATALIIVLSMAWFSTGAISAQEVTPTATFDAGIDLVPGVVPTKFGDVTVPDAPERIVTLTDGALDAMLALGVAPVGATTSANFEGPAAYLADDVPDSVVYVGGWGELDIEKIVTLQPDLILADRYLADDIYATLSEIAPVVAPTEIDVAGPDALQQWEYEALVWGHAVGKDQSARDAIAAVRDRAANIKNQLGAHAGESVVVFRPQPTFPVVMSHHWITGTVLTWSGLTGNDFTNELPPPHSGSSVSLEQLQLLDADWLFLAVRDEEQRQAIASYEANPLFQTLRAVKNKQVEVVSGDLWSGATGVLAAHAMLNDIERIMLGSGPSATPPTS